MVEIKNIRTIELSFVCHFYLSPAVLFETMSGAYDVTRLLLKHLELSQTLTN